MEVDETKKLVTSAFSIGHVVQSYVSPRFADAPAAVNVCVIARGTPGPSIFLNAEEARQLAADLLAQAAKAEAL